MTDEEIRQLYEQYVELERTADETWNKYVTDKRENETIKSVENLKK